MSAPAASVAAVREVLRAHNIECTSKATGEASCRGCRDEGWMSYTKYHEHVAVAAADAAVEAATPGIQAGALRGAAEWIEHHDAKAATNVKSVRKWLRTNAYRIEADHE